jgi:hypothetical protein
MNPNKKHSHKSIFVFALGMLGVFLLSLTLRFWQLERFNTLVFDEVYYAKFANDYLTKTPFFNAHPPLSQYIIAIGIWIGTHLPFGQNSRQQYGWLPAFPLGLPLAECSHRFLYSPSCGSPSLSASSAPQLTLFLLLYLPPATVYF